MKLFSTLQIAKGPVFNLDDLLRPKFIELSKFSSGTIVSMAPEPGEHRIGNYKVVLVDGSKGYGVLPTLKFVFAAIREGRKLSKEGKLDLAVSYDPLTTGVTACIVKFLYGAKTICEVNGVYDSEELYKFKSSLNLKFKRFFYPKIQQLILRLSDGIKVLYPEQIDCFRLKENTRKFCFFDFSSIKKGEYSENLEHSLLTLGFPAYIKGVDILISAFNRLSGDFPEWKLLIVGWFSGAEVNEMTDLAKKNKQIEIRKPVPFTEIPALLDACDIFVLASRTEAMGRVLIEAMARGRARIASRVNGIPTVVDDNEDGLLFEKENVDELSKRLRSLMESETLRKQLSQSGLERFSREFTLGNYVKRVEEMYLAVCDAKREG